jgi:polyisoprenoid-binding protein YceI
MDMNRFFLFFYFLLSCYSWQILNAQPSKMANAEIVGQARFISDAPIEKVEGTGEIKGQLSILPKDISSLKASLKIPVASMKTGNDTRDEHLRAQDWLDAARCPNLIFETQKVKVSKSENRGNITEYQLEIQAILEIRCEKKEITVRATLKLKDQMLRIASNLSIELIDFKVKGRSGMIPEKVSNHIQIDIQARGNFR